MYPYADAVEFLKIGLVYHEELESLEKRHAAVRRLQKHALVEGKPAQLSVYIAVFFFDIGHDTDLRISLLNITAAPFLSQCRGKNKKSRPAGTGLLYY